MNKENNHYSASCSRREFLEIAGSTFLALSYAATKYRLGFAATPESSELNPDNTTFPLPELINTETTFIGQPKDDLKLMLFPLSHNYNYKYWLDSQRKNPAGVMEFTMHNTPIVFQNFYKEQDGNRIFSVLPNTLTSSYLPIAVVSENGKEQITANNDTYDSMYSMVEDFYPNKIINILEGLKAIDEYQQEIGGFVPGTQYSMLKILDIPHRVGYVLGKNSANEIVTAGGVCALATTLFRSLTLAGGKDIERWEHPSGKKYFCNPFGSTLLSERNSDTTIDLEHDFRFTVKQPTYIKISSEICPKNTGIAPEFGSPEHPNDALLIASIGTIQKNLSPQSENIEAIKQNYLEYRKSGTNSRAHFIFSPWSEKSTEFNFVKRIYQEENVKGFESDINSNELFKELVELRSLVNSFSQTSGKTGIGKYLMETKWYQKQIDRLIKQNSTDDIKDFVSTIRSTIESQTWVTPNQPLQCIGLSSIIGALHHPSLPAVNVGNYSITRAAAYIAEGFRNNPVPQMIHPSNGYQMYSTDSISEVTPGSHFVLANNKIGHIGTVLAKKTINNKPTLLCIDCNASSNGQIHIFKVDESNWDNKFGPYPVKKYFIAPPKK